MLCSRLSFVAAFALAACTATTTSNGLGTDPTNPNPANPDPANPDPTNPNPTNPNPTNQDPTNQDPDPKPVKMTFEYSSVPLPAMDLQIGSIGGSSGSDVWIVASKSTATSKDPWNAYHYDGTNWTTTKLTQSTGRPSFGVVSTGSSAFLGFSYSGEVFKLSGSSLTLVASFQVTSGYSMALIGSTVFVGTQENYGAGPLYKIANGTAKQVPVDQGIGGVLGIWGATEDDVWLARSEGLGHFVGGKYEDTDPNSYADVHGSAKNNVWAVGENGVRRFDGTKWSEVPFPLGSSRYDAPSSVSVLSTDEVVVTTGDGKIYRYDGTTFVLDSRANAPKSAANVGHVGKDEAWLVDTTSIGRLSPRKK